MNYIVGHPIKRPSDFYGRHEQIQRFYEIVGGSQAQSVSVLGLRRAGKTSFLQHVAHPEVLAQHVGQPERYTFVYLDVSTCKSPAHFYGRLLAKLQAKLGKAPAMPTTAQATLYDVEMCLYHFPQQRVVLLLDEFDQVNTGAFGMDFFTELRALTGVMDYDVACVTASYADLYTLGRRVGLPPTSPFYNIFYPTPIYLSGLRAAVARQLICQPAAQAGVQFDEADVQEMLALAGTLPFFLQATAAYWMQGAASSGAVARALVTDLSPYFEQWWRHFTQEEKTLLQGLSQRHLMAQLPYGSPVLSQAVRLLQRYGLIVAGEGGWQLNGRLLQQWLCERVELPPAVPETAVLPPQPTHLRRVIDAHFSLEEIRTLCFDLGIDFEQLAGSEKNAKARSLVAYCQRRDDLPRLLSTIRQERGAIV